MAAAARNGALYFELAPTYGFFFTDEATGEKKKFLQNRGIAALLELLLRQ